eukprot:TRINITY_DN6893_c0_g1_i13.p2 TRINITY_DN6893_c0_g1~~TRINITY_DN6893_c0_g1_i13.p2  ORF type:complete len:156 (+),score=54.29 TRINITY_DN6893_c0_g1_i13:188-655(+)
MKDKGEDEEGAPRPNVLLFDGVCKFCDFTVNFIIDRDPEARVSFAPLQSVTGQRLLTHFRLPNNLDTVVLVQGEHVFTRSTAILRVLRELGGLYALLFYVFVWVPAFIRDSAYSLFAAYRYRLFGETDSCRAPTKDVRRRFLRDDYDHGGVLASS